MSDLLKELGERVKALGGNWTAYTVTGSFLLYVLGYLSLRFHLTALGVVTDIGVLDERYLFTGARFLVYLAVALPSVVLIVVLLGAGMYSPYCLLRAVARGRLDQWEGRFLAWPSPGRLIVVGIVFSVLIIQFLMRDCFELNDLLLRKTIPEKNMLAAWLSRRDEARISLFFTALVAAAGLSTLVLLRLFSLALQDGPQIWGRYFLTVLVAIQVLLLPVNFGYLVLDKSLPQVASLDGVTPLAEGTQAWLVWEGTEGMTFLIRTLDSDEERRSLVTLPRGKATRTEIVASNPIVPTLYNRKPEKAP